MPEFRILELQSDTEAQALGQHDVDVLLRQLFQVFLILGMSSFGGGLSGWMHRELVEKRRWVTMQEFLTGLSLARAMPGMNAINLAIWIGYKLRGRRGFQK